LGTPDGYFEVGNLDPQTFIDMQRVLIILKHPEEGDFRLSVDDVRASISPDLSQTNQLLRQYLDVLTSHDAMNNTFDFFTFSASELVSGNSSFVLLVINDSSNFSTSKIHSIMDGRMQICRRTL
jgi:hypothetical protein